MKLFVTQQSRTCQIASKFGKKRGFSKRDNATLAGAGFEIECCRTGRP